jgi:TonB-dependent receptor
MDTQHKHRRSLGACLLYTTLAAGFSAQALAAVVTGTVTDASGFRALGGAEVELVELQRRTRADSAGRYRFADVAPGRYTVRASYAGVAPLEQSITVGAGADDVVTADLGLGDTSEDMLESVLVVGQRANLASSLSRQRSAETVQSVLTRDAIGQFPDQNVAESVRRVSGVNVLNDQGEGRFIAVRGLAPDLNAASINGARVPAPEADVRSVALDVLPAELIESIEIKKSLTPDMDADTIGASIEINTTSAFDRRDPYLGVTAQGSYNDLTGEWSPKASVDFSRRVTERFGIAGGISYYNRAFATDNVEMDGWNETDAGVAYADTVEYRDYDVERQRLGMSLSLDFRPTDQTTLFARTLFSDFEDQEFRGRLIFEMDEEPAAGDANGARFSSDDGQIRVERDIKDRFETQRILSLVAGGQTFAGPWTFDYSASWSKAREKENGSLDPTIFRRDFEDPGELGVSFDYRDLSRIGYAVTNGAAAFLDPAEYEFEAIERTTLSLAEDEEISARVDVKKEISLSRGSLEMQGGLKLRQREKTNDAQLDIFDGFDGDLTLADVVGRQSFGIASIDPQVDPGAVRSLFRSQLAAFERNELDSTFESAVADFSVEEDITAGYLLGRYVNGPLKLVGGLRFERTENDIRGNLVELVEEGGTRGGVVLDDDTVFITPRSIQRSYSDTLPSLNLRYEARPDVLLRAAAYASVVRPNIGNLAPRFIVEENDEGEREGEFGNPDLEPYEAVNLDLGVEWYFDGKGVLQAGLFYKDIDNFIALAQFNDVTFNGIFANEALIPINGDSAEVRGVEIGYQQALTFLPAPFDGLIMGFNYTYTDTEAEVNGRSIPLPAASKNNANLSIGYEKGPWSLRLAGAYRDSYLDELGDNAEEDRYVKSHLQWDLSAKYRVSPAIQVFAELVNGLDEPYLAYQRGPGRDRLLQYEEYSWTGIVGVKVSF